MSKNTIKGSECKQKSKTSKKVQGGRCKNVKRLKDRQLYKCKKK